MTENIYILLLINASLLLIFAIFISFEYFYNTKSHNTQSHSEFSQPVSIFITVYNGEKYIEQRIHYFLHPDEWINGSELIIISPGSTDNTNQIINQFKDDSRVQIIIEKKITKIQCLNKYVPLAKNELLILSDFRQKVRSGSVKNLIRHFQDPEIAVVSSTLLDQNNTNFSFRNVLNKMAFNKLTYGSSLNVFGALYAQRKKYFTSFPENLLFDDLFVVANTLRQKKRLIQDKEAIIEDLSFENYYQKERIERLARGLLIFISTQKQWIFKLPFKQCMRFLFYKYFKLLLPLIFLIFIFSFLLLLSPFQILLIFACLLLIALTFRKITSLFLRINFYFLSAAFKFLVLNRRSNQWEPLKNQLK